MADSLKKQTVGALKWSMIQEVAQKCLQFGIGIMMARLLSPEEFGLIALLTVLVVVAQVLLESGFGSALIQKKDLGQDDESSVFFFNIALGFLLAGLFWLIAPLVAAFYKHPELTALLRALAAILVINGFAVVQNALMVRRLEFRKQTIISLGGAMASGAVGLTLAWKGFGVWSLVAQQITNSFVRTVMSWGLNRWRPVWTFSQKALRDMLRFGSGMTASMLLNTIFQNLYALVIGKIFPAAQLGYYNRAQTLQGVASSALGSMANRVTFPVFSKLQNDPVRLRNGLRRAMQTLVFVQFPMMIGMAVVARPLVLLLLTDKWAPSIPYLQALCFVGLLHPVHMLNVNILMAMGRSDLLLRVQLIKYGLLCIGLLVTAPMGILAIIWGQVTLSLVCLGINSWYSNRLVGYSFIEQVRDFGPYLAVAATMGMILLALDLSFIPSLLGQVLTQVVIGGTLYGVLSLWFRLDAVAELLGILRPRSPASA